MSGARSRSVAQDVLSFGRFPGVDGFKHTWRSTSTLDFIVFHAVPGSKLGPVPIKIPTQPDYKGAIPASDRGGVQIDRLAFSGQKPHPVARCGDLAGSHRWSKDRSEKKNQAYLNFHVPPERKK